MKNYTKFIAILLSIFVSFALLIRLLEVLYIQEINKNPDSPVSQNKILESLFKNVEEKYYITKPNTKITITKFLGIQNKIPELNLLEDKKWKCNVIHIFSSWCGQCRNEITTVDKIKSKLSHKKDKITFTGLIFDDNIDDGLHMLQHFPKLYDKIGYLNSEQGIELGIKSIPVSMIINQDGIILYRNNRPLLEKDIKDIEQLCE